LIIDTGENVLFSFAGTKLIALCFVGVSSFGLLDEAKDYECKAMFLVTSGFVNQKQENKPAQAHQK
jgi:hypothetical protein